MNAHPQTAAVAVVSQSPRVRVGRIHRAPKPTLYKDSPSSAPWSSGKRSIHVGRAPLSRVLAATALLVLLTAHGTEALVRIDEFGGTELPVEFLNIFIYDTYGRAKAEDVMAGRIADHNAALLELSWQGGSLPSHLVVYSDDEVDVDDFHKLQLDVESGAISCDEFVGGSPFSTRLVASSAPENGEQHLLIRRVVWQESRPRVWFLALAHCDTGAATVAAFANNPFRYNLTMVNPGDAFTRQFSKDEQGLMITIVVFGFLYGVVSLFLLLDTCGKFHVENFVVVFRSLAMIAFAQWAALGMRAVHLVMFYSVDGIGIPMLEVIGRVLDRLHTVGLMLLFIVLMKGWKTGYTGVNRVAMMLSVAFGFLIAGGYVLIAAWEQLGGQPVSVLNLWESPPGITVLGLRLLFMLWFTHSAVVRIRKQSFSASRRRFFTRLAVAVGLWFATVPATVALSLTLEIWVRAKVVEIVELSGNFAAMCAAAYLLQPGHLNDVFNTVDTIVVGAAAKRSQVHVDSETKKVSVEPFQRDTDDQDEVRGAESASTSDGRSKGKQRGKKSRKKKRKVAPGISDSDEARASRPSAASDVGSSMAEEERRRLEAKKLEEMRALRMERGAQKRDQGDAEVGEFNGWSSPARSTPGRMVSTARAAHFVIPGSRIRASPAPYASPAGTPGQGRGAVVAPGGGSEARARSFGASDVSDMEDGVPPMGGLHDGSDNSDADDNGWHGLSRTPPGSVRIGAAGGLPGRRMGGWGNV